MLDDAVDEAAVRARLRDPRFARRRLAHLYLDQSFLAGMGNYLRSEVLFGARLWPELRPADLVAAAIRRLAKESLEVPRRSLVTGGITVRPPLARRLKREGMSRRAMRHYVFGRDGRPCHRCGTAIRKERMAGRRLYLCPECQPAPAGPDS